MNVRASGNDLELWHVQLGGVVRTMTLDELDNAFQSGVIDEHTNVLKAGALRWTTLGDVAGLDDEGAQPAFAASDEQPNSIAPFATDISSYDAMPIPPLANPNFDVSFGTEELAVFKPKRSVGRAFFAVALVLAIGGGLFAVKSYGTAGLRAKAAQVASLIKHKPAAPSSTALAAAAMAPPAAQDLPPPSPTISINSLPAAGALAATTPPPPPPDKNAKKKAEAAAKKGKAAATTQASKKSNANDPTQKGAGQFDPLNGKL